VSESALYRLELELVAVFASGFFLAFVLNRLRRVDPRLAIGWAITVAFAIRTFAALALDQLSVAGQLRGGDELVFLARAKVLSDTGLFSTKSFDTLIHSFQTFFLSVSFDLFTTPPATMLRIEVVALSVAGLALTAGAVALLAGPRAGLIAAWILALEPANIFFTGILHKEPFMFVAEGLVVYGGAWLWKRGDWRALLPMIAGCLIAIATRTYAGWFLAAAAALVALHASLRRNSASNSLAMAAVIGALLVAFFPAVWNASSKRSLSNLQFSQNANASDKNANLALERVDYSTRDKVILNLPKRMADILTRPYPWQLGNASQQLGAFATLFLFVLFLPLGLALFTHRGAILTRAGPLIYPALLLLVAYALSAGNAGTGFRYRTHVVGLLIGLLVVLAHERMAAWVGSHTRAGRQPNTLVAQRSAPTLAR
jgi:hypothetical protein